MKYQIIVNRKLMQYGQFVTEGRDEINTMTIHEEDRPFIFSTKLRAVERRTLMKKIRGVLKKDCWLQVHEKGGDSGISGLCLSCPACWLFGGTYAPGRNKEQVNERTKISYSDAYPLTKLEIRDVTFNAVDEKRTITGQAVGVNQVVGPGDFISVVDIDAENDDWVKLAIWCIIHSDKYGGNVRIYGQMKNEILGVIKSDKLEITSWDLANKYTDIESVKNFLKTFDSKLEKIDQEQNIGKLIEELNKSEEVKELRERKENTKKKG